MTQIRILIVDDSAFMRKIITDMLSQQPDFEVVGTARDGIDALKKIESLRPDVLTLDVEMPKLNGIQVMRELSSKGELLPIIMLSSATQAGSSATIEALSLGAVDFIPKPSGAISLDIKSVQDELVRKVRAAAQAKLPSQGRNQQREAKASVSAHTSTKGTKAEKLVVIGSSTGGPRALEAVIKSLPAELPAGVVIVQHMPAGFTTSLAKRLDGLTPLNVREAKENDLIQVGTVLIAPGDYHMIIENSRIKLNQEAPVHFVRPAIDPTMSSAVKSFGSRILGVIMTGMGRDGAIGMAEIKNAGGKTLVQNKETATIYSMPKAVVDDGNADEILPLEEIGQRIQELITRI